MSQQIRDSLYTKLTAVQTAGTVYALTEGRIYETQAPEAAGLPCLVYVVSEDPQELYFGGSRTERCAIDFEIRGAFGTQTYQQPGGGSPGAQAVGAIEEALHTLLHGVSVSCSGRDRCLFVCQSRGVPEVDGGAHLARAGYVATATVLT